MNIWETAKMRKWAIVGIIAMTGCGPGAALQPLVGEGPEVFELMETDGSRRFDDAPTLTARHLFDLLESRQFSAAWPLLSKRTQEALQRDFARDGEEGDSQLLSRISRDTRSPTPTAILFGQRPTQLTSYDPAGAPKPAPPTARAGHALVFASGQDGVTTRVHMVYDGSKWQLDTGKTR